MQYIDILGLEGGSAGALGATLDIFDVANGLSSEPLFKVRLLSESGRVPLRGGIEIEAPSACSVKAHPIVLVLGAGSATPAAMQARLKQSQTRQVCNWIRGAHEAGGTVTGSCTGVYFLGAAGLLNGRRCTTTWWLGTHLQGLFAGCHVSPDAMVVEDGRVWTAGAALAQIDLTLGLVERLATPALAQETASRLLVERRPSQSPFAMASNVVGQNALAQQFEALVQATLANQPSLEHIAQKLGVSTRTLDRRIRAATQLSPMRLAQRIRLRTAIELLQNTRLSHAEIAEQVGYNDAASLYRLIVRHTGMRPGLFRRCR